MRIAPIRNTKLMLLALGIIAFLTGHDPAPWLVGSFILGAIQYATSRP